jgi:hypothetical protein
VQGFSKREGGKIMPYVRNKSISVVITKTGPKSATFELNENNGKGPTDEIRFHNNKHPGLVVYFNIKDPDGTDLEFRPDPGDSMCVAAPIGTGKNPPPCPPPNGAKWAGFVPLSVEKDKGGKRTQLIAYFRNETEAKCRFALRFLWPDGTPEDYDPIGDGANGLRA